MNNIEEYVNTIKRKLKRIDAKLSSYEENENNLSKHAYWSFGYFKGAKYELENVLDDIEEMLNKTK